MLDAQPAPAREDTENLINIPRSIDGVEVAVLLKAFSPTNVRVSLRSRGDRGRAGDRPRASAAAAIARPPDAPSRWHP